jgi:uncharacterized protein YbjQ (UPF0145 family)
MIIVTTEAVAGREVAETLGLVRGSTVLVHRDPAYIEAAGQSAAALVRSRSA